MDEIELLRQHKRENRLEIQQATTQVIWWLFGYEFETRMIENLSHNQRIGQAFFNALSEIWQDQLRGGPLDPYYSDDCTSVLAAAAFLAKGVGQ